MLSTVGRGARKFTSISVDSYRLKGLRARLVNAKSIQNAKEKLGLGGGIVIIARKKRSRSGFNH